MPPKLDLPRRSSPLLAKADPYATRAHRTIDLLLVLLTALLIFIAFRTGAKTPADQHATESTQSTQVTAK